MPEDKWLEINSKKIFYRKMGTGTPVVLIHGFAEDGRIWDNQVAELKKEFQFIVPDLPGSGKSVADNPTDIPSTMDGFAGLIKNILDSEKIDHCIIIGHSMGGYITLAFAEKFPETLVGFGLLHSTAFADSDEKKAVREKSIVFIQKNGSSDFIRQSTPNLFSGFTKKNNPKIIVDLIERYDNFNPKALVSYYKAMILRPDRTKLLHNFKKPVLFVIGEEDNAVPLNDSLKLCHIPAISYIHIIENTGHMGMLESTPEVNKFLKAFINKVGV